MKREDAQALFSDYLENELNPSQRDKLQAYLAQEPEAAAELISLERTLSLLHRLPDREPSLDLWRELTPEIEAFRAERRLNLPLRLRGQWAEFLSSVSEGVILWTHALARRAHHRLGPHLKHDPWHTEKERR
ncbi:MAG: anti-sigma factor family protein [Janthinobacterium lividum]